MSARCPATLHPPPPTAPRVHGPQARPQPSKALVVHASPDAWRSGERRQEEAGPGTAELRTRRQSMLQPLRGLLSGSQQGTSLVLSAALSASILLQGAPASAEIQTVSASEATALAKPLKEQAVPRRKIWGIFTLGAIALFGATAVLENNEKLFPAIFRANNLMKRSKAEVEAAMRAEEEQARAAAEQARLQSAVAAGLQEASTSARAPEGQPTASAAASVLGTSSASIGSDSAREALTSATSTPEGGSGSGSGSGSGVAGAVKSPSEGGSASSSSGGVSTVAGTGEGGSRAQTGAAASSSESLAQPQLRTQEGRQPEAGREGGQGEEAVRQHQAVPAAASGGAEGGVGRDPGAGGEGAGTRGSREAESQTAKQG